MRKELEPYYKQKLNFIAKIGTINNNNYVINDAIKIQIYSLTDHMWIPNDDEFKKLNLKEGDIKTFKGEIIRYYKLRNKRNARKGAPKKWTADYKVKIDYSTVKKIRVK